ncbi:MAG: N-acetylmuramoyl-L-alanine amidase [Chitinophagaceae bacterium]|nr:MAG: N-acetylmuramoyl-L-alanine amidase [Chitinophagaceae bacterium]
MILVHEFIADKKAVSDNNPETFSEMLLMSAFPDRRFSLTSHLFSSPIKRRLYMVTTFNKSKAGLFGKWMALPVMLILLASFSLRKKEVVNTPHATFTVMIDAGHGGSANGATAADGTMEKDINLMIAKKIKELNKNDQLKIIMTRERDEETALRARVEQASKLKVDAFISIHVNTDPGGKSGMQVIMTKNAGEYAEKSQLLGSLLSQELKKVYTIDGDLRKGPADRGVWVLDAPEINYPSILVECGNMTNEKDLKFVKSSANQEKIAQHILNAISLFADQKTSYIPQPKPSAVAILIEKGEVSFDLVDNKIVKAAFSPLAKASIKMFLLAKNTSQMSQRQ